VFPDQKDLLFSSKAEFRQLYGQRNGKLFTYVTFTLVTQHFSVMYRLICCYSELAWAISTSFLFALLDDQNADL
jgi:hypothetical protein